MTEFDLKPELKLVSVRCYYCNRFYCYEKQHSARCPHCAETQVAELEATIKQLERSNAALRGHLGKRG